ncbi:MAG: hypothetical protein BAJALOKI1v1_960002 [Promethearchaeota archaeon]|nr:MAG: hypothetical protein BAJALOKI1v1_960002 [Candidatus Lokiarchaeota archaeon]
MKIEFGNFYCFFDTISEVIEKWRKIWLTPKIRIRPVDYLIFFKTVSCGDKFINVDKDKVLYSILFLIKSQNIDQDVNHIRKKFYSTERSHYVCLNNYLDADQDKNWILRRNEKHFSSITSLIHNAHYNHYFEMGSLTKDIKKIINYYLNISSF